MSNNQKTITDFEWWENLYDEPGFFGNFFRRRMEMAISWINEMNFPGNAIIFDAGCGGSRFVNEATIKGFRTIGMDHSMRMLEKSQIFCEQKPCNQASFFQGDVEVVPVRDSSLDAIICLGVISYLKSEVAVLSEFARALKPGGLLILSATNKARLVRRLDIPLIAAAMKKKIFQHGNLQMDDDSPNIEDQHQRSY